jgi:hypothetical protein
MGRLLPHDGAIIPADAGVLQLVPAAASDVDCD